MCRMLRVVSMMLSGVVGFEGLRCASCWNVLDDGGICWVGRRRRAALGDFVRHRSRGRDLAGSHRTRVCMCQYACAVCGARTPTQFLNATMCGVVVGRFSSHAPELTAETAELMSVTLGTTGMGFIPMTACIASRTATECTSTTSKRNFCQLAMAAACAENSLGVCFSAHEAPLCRAACESTFSLQFVPVVYRRHTGSIGKGLLSSLAGFWANAANAVGGSRASWSRRLPFVNRSQTGLADRRRDGWHRTFGSTTVLYGVNDSNLVLAAAGSGIVGQCGNAGVDRFLSRSLRSCRQRIG